MADISAHCNAEREAGIITPEQVRAFIHPRQDSPLTGLRLFIVRLEGRPEWICGVYSSEELANQHKHRHQFNTDEIVSFVVDEPPLLFEEPPANFDQI